MSRLTKPGPDDQLRAILKGSSFDDYDSPLFIAWQINSACNLECLHCCEEAGHSMPDEMTREQALDFCRQIAELDIPYMAISGGEPLVWPHINKFVKACNKKGIKISIYSSGNVDTFRPLIKGIKKIGLNRIIFSIFAADSEAHEQITRVRGSFNKTISAVKDSLSESIETEFHFVPVQPSRMGNRFAHQKWLVRLPRYRSQ